MEQEQLHSGEEALVSLCDRETFERVWRRVMPQPRPDCPVQLLSDLPQGEVPQPETSLAVRPQEPPVIPVGVPNPVISAEGDVPSLGPSSAIYGGQLQAFVDHALTQGQIYQTLARRVHGLGGRTLATLATEKRRHAKRLSTAYFLISGVTYWPVSGAPIPIKLAYPAALRQCFYCTQRNEGAYRAAAEETADPALRELYLDLAHDEGRHTWLLRGVLEQRA